MRIMTKTRRSAATFVLSVLAGLAPVSFLGAAEGLGQTEQGAPGGPAWGNRLRSLGDLRTIPSSRNFPDLGIQGRRAGGWTQCELPEFGR